MRAAHANEMVVSWSTGASADESFVDYWPAAGGGAAVRVAGTRKTFVDGRPERRTQYLHRALLTRLQPGSRYCKCNTQYTVLYVCCNPTHFVFWRIVQGVQVCLLSAYFLRTRLMKYLKLRISDLLLTHLVLFPG